MDNYVTGSAIKKLRERENMTQAEQADKLGVSHKTISKWETARGLPDITLIEPLSKALKISVAELLAGDYVTNRNISCNMQRSGLYVCPVCGNIIQSAGEAVVSCCGITLPALEAEETDEVHHLCLEKEEDEYYITVSHEMTKEHYISFIAYVTSERWDLVKLYPEGDAQARFTIKGHGILYLFCNKHGLMKQKI